MKLLILSLLSASFLLSPASADETSEVVKKFTDSLTSRDVIRITQDNPYALAPLLGGFGTLPMPKRVGQCTKQEFERIKKKVGIKALAEKAIPSMRLLTTEDTLFRERYAKRAAELAGEMSLSDNEKAILISHFTAQSESPILKLDDSHRKTMIGEKAEQIEALVKTGVPASAALKTAYEMAKISLPCIAQMNIQIHEYVKKERN